MKQTTQRTDFSYEKRTENLWRAEKVPIGKHKKQWVSKREVTVEWDDESEYMVVDRQWVLPNGFRELVIDWKPDEYLNMDPFEQNEYGYIYPGSNRVSYLTPDIIEHRDYPGIIKETGEKVTIHCYVRYDTYDPTDIGEMIAPGTFIRRKPPKKIMSSVYYLNEEDKACELRSNPRITKLNVTSDAS